MPDGNGDFWNPEHLSTSDPLNEEIWRESVKLEKELLNPGDVGAQQAMVGKPILPWVPDIVGKNWREPGGLMIVGSAYAGFIKEYTSSQQRAMPVAVYARSTDPFTFQKNFFEYIIKADISYYRRIKYIADRLKNVSLEKIVLFDLCRASFVSRDTNPNNHNIIDQSGDGVVKENCSIFAKYVEGQIPKNWIWSRITNCGATCIVALGTIAEHGLLRLFSEKGLLIKDYRNKNNKLVLKKERKEDEDKGMWVTKYADDTKNLAYWLLNEGNWWVIEGLVNDQPRKWNLLPICHPARYSKKKYDQSIMVLQEMMKS